jgi:HSP20 family molecular chaperone IbpA
MKKTLVLLLAALAFCVPARAADTANDPRMDQVRENNRAYLQEIKRMSLQYMEFTGEMKQVIAEEGLPTWSEEGGVVVTKPAVTSDAPVTETDTDMTVKLDLPGLRKDTLKVSIEDDKMLHVRATRKDPVEEIERIVALPASAEGARAQYEDGVLTVTVKKAHSKAISVPVR